MFCEEIAGGRSAFVVPLEAKVDDFSEILGVELRNRKVSIDCNGSLYLPRMILRMSEAWFCASKGCRKVQSS
jgi:hypothetical protein